MSSLSSYLASKYLTADPSSTSKKRKRKNASTQPGLIIADDDAPGWTTSSKTQTEDDGRPITVSSHSAEFRKAKKNAWKVVGTPVLQPKDEDAETAAADRIIQAAADENSAAQHADEAPVVEHEGGAADVVKMGDGTHAGLQSAAAVAEQFAKRKREEAAAWEAEEKAAGRKGKKGEDTIYRDATGRRIDLQMRRQEARRELDEQARKEKEALEQQRGDVQRVMKQARKMELDEARFLPFASKVAD